MFILAPPENAAATELERQLADAEQRGAALLEQRERERMERYRATAERLLLWPAPSATTTRASSGRAGPRA